MIPLVEKFSSEVLAIDIATFISVFGEPQLVGSFGKGLKYSIISDTFQGTKFIIYFLVSNGEYSFYGYSNCTDNRSLSKVFLVNYSNSLECIKTFKEKYPPKLLEVLKKFAKENIKKLKKKNVTTESDLVIGS